MRIVTLEPAQADELDQVTCALAGGVGVAALAFQPLHDVVENGPPWQQARFLEHHRAVATRPSYWLAIDQYLTGGGLDQAVDDFDECRLAATARSHDRNKFLSPTSISTPARATSRLLSR